MSPKSEWQIADEVLKQDAQTKQELRDSRKKLEIYEALDSASINKIPKYTAGRGSAIAVALLSDVHIEERVDPEDVPGVVNIYNPEVCRKRLEQFWQRVVVLTDAHRNLTDIKTLCLGLLGDIITGYLHDDQRESNYLAPLEAILLAEELVSSGLEYLLSYGNFEKIIIPCTPGNHGRTTRKPRAKTAMETNLEWMLYQHLYKRWGNEKRLEWHIASGAHVYLELNGYICRFHHGDDVRYGGGVGGLSIPLLKAIAQWNKGFRADYDFLGHWHTCRDFGHAVVNGSTIGYNAYALKSKCDYEDPKQAYCLIDSKRGKCAFMDIWTDWLPPGLERKKK